MSERRPYTVPEVRVDVARRHGLGFARLIALAAGDAGIPYRIACALIEQESGGRNVWGNDAGGTFSGYPGPVTRDGYAIFYWLVVEQGALSNGVGPAQITWRGYLADARERGYRLWVPSENLAYAFEHILGPFADQRGTWHRAVAAYHDPDEGQAEDYAEQVMARAEVWAERFRKAGA
jgi:hypothetical protein